MHKFTACIGALALLSATANAAQEPTKDSASVQSGQTVFFQPEEVHSEGSVTIGGQRTNYKAIAGTIIVHPEGWDDTAWREKSQSELEDKQGATAEASMFYAAYFKKGAPEPDRPITFLYNGGPGAASLWLHMGGLGPRRVLTGDATHSDPAPYRTVDNIYSLLDASDLVFIDAPGAGFSRIAGKDKEKSFYGVDADAYAFADFIKQFLSRYDRWNSPKYLLGESYGTPRTAVLVNMLQTNDDIDFNGVILLSQILNFSLNPDSLEANPGQDQGYVIALPAMAATAWYHNLLSGQRPDNLQGFLREVENFALTDYTLALNQGAALDPSHKQAIAQKMSEYIGLPLDYIIRANLRITGPVYSKKLQESAGLTTGRLDTRYSGPDLNPLSSHAEYDPQSPAMSSAYVSAFNDYVRSALRLRPDNLFKPSAKAFKYWDFAHEPPGANIGFPLGTNVMGDLAMAMKQNPKLKVMTNNGYFDLGTPYFQSVYEMRHLPIPDSLQSNIESHFYMSGHKIFVTDEGAKQLHDNVADFIRRTDNLP